MSSKDKSPLEWLAEAAHCEEMYAYTLRLNRDLSDFATDDHDWVTLPDGTEILSRRGSVH